MIRKAKLSDVNEIQGVIAVWAEKGRLLQRPLNYLFEHLRDFWVYTKNGRVVGCCALNVVGWQKLAEIKSLAVAETHHGKGIGSALVHACMKEASEIGIGEVFALTYVPRFFKQLGFKVIDRKRLPHKIWNDCINCPDFPDCGEIAVITAVRKKNKKK